jgi:hypothetical protein
VADKRNIRKNLKRIETVKTWQLIILLILALFITATFLRLNNTGMISRRNAIQGIDKSGDVQDTASRIYDIQRYAASHMNADTGVFYLQGQYDRDVKAAVAAASGDSDSGDNSPQAKADAICNPNLQIHGYSLAYQNCMLEQLDKQGQVVDPASITLPNPALYRYSFNSPLWSPDFAGWSVVVSLLLAVTIVVRAIAWIVLKLLLKRHYRQI